MKSLKVLVLEYITGGGFNKSELPSSLAREGLLMLNALANDLSEIVAVDIVAMLDTRLRDRVKIPADKLVLIHAEDDCWQYYLELIQTCDAVWPIAPESGGILQKLCEAAELSGRILLTSPPSAVALAGDKWLTYLQLQHHSIATVATQRLAGFDFTGGEWVIKPMDGVGCEDSHLILSYDEFNQLIQKLEFHRYIIQPHLQGQKTSLSCLFKEGKGWLVSVNLQYFDVSNNQYRLTGIDVNFKFRDIKYKLLVENIAKAMPDLWGYVGIDLIENGEEILVLEINPRLTSSYAGIKTACGINCAAAVLDLLSGEPKLNPTKNRSEHIGLAT